MEKYPLKDSGQIAAIARALGLSYETVRLWAVQGRVPIKHLAAVVRLTGLPPRSLAPALYSALDEVEAAWAMARRKDAA